MNILDANITKKEIVRPIELVNEMLHVLLSISNINKSLIKLTKKDYDVIEDSISDIRNIIDIVKDEQNT
jgi:hypothetical protein